MATLSDRCWFCDDVNLEEAEGNIFCPECKEEYIDDSECKEEYIDDSD